MKKVITLIILVALAGCSSNSHELSQVRKSDPYWQLNRGKWTAHENDLTQAPTVSAPL